MSAAYEAQKRHYAAVKRRLGMGGSAPIVKHISELPRPVKIDLPKKPPEPPSELDVEAVILRAMITAHSGNPPLRLVMLATGQHYGATVAQMSSRARRFCRPRQVAFYVARALTGMSLPQIGAAMGKDHTTVLHGIRVVEALVAAGDPKTIAAITAIKAVLEGSDGH